MLIKQLLESKEPAWHLVGTTGVSLTSHTTSSSFKTEEAAKAYKLKFKHSPAMKKAKIVFGTSDEQGWITPVTESLKEAVDQDPKPLLDALAEAEKKMNEIDKAMNEVIKITSSMPRLFKQNIHGGNLNNLENPKEYSIRVGIENIKSLYGLSQEFRDTVRGMEILKKQLKAYKG